MGKRDDDEQIEEVAKLLRQLTHADEEKDEQTDEVLEFTELLQGKSEDKSAPEDDDDEEEADYEPLRQEIHLDEEKSTTNNIEILSDEEPENEEPVTQEAVKEEAVKEEPVNEEPVKEEPVDEEPVKEEPVKEEPVKEAPAEKKTAEKSGGPVKNKNMAVKKTSKAAQERREKTKKPEEKEPEIVKLSPGKLAATLVRKIIFCISLGVFVFALTSLLVLLWGYYISQREYDQLNEDYVVIGTATAPENSGEDDADAVISVSTNDTEEDDSVPFLDITVDERKLKALNEDYAFYIVVPGTNVQYPVVQGEDNNHYLRYTYSNQENTAGSIQVDYRTDRDTYLQPFNTIIHGHNRQDGTMFSDMTKYIDESFRDENPYIYIILDDKEYVYEIFAFYEMEPVAVCYNPNTSAETYLDFINKNNTYTGGIEVTLEDHIISLYTCNDDSSMRYLIHAVLREVYDLS